MRVLPAAGWLVLASDAAHFTENYTARSLYRQLVDVRAGLPGFDRLTQLASAADLIPGHGPAVLHQFPHAVADAAHIVELA